MGHPVQTYTHVLELDKQKCEIMLCTVKTRWWTFMTDFSYNKSYKVMAGSEWTLSLVLLKQ